MKERLKPFVILRDCEIDKWDMLDITKEFRKLIPILKTEIEKKIDIRKNWKSDNNWIIRTIWSQFYSIERSLGNMSLLARKLLDEKNIISTEILLDHMNDHGRYKLELEEMINKLE
jgi:hypothetical protein